MNDRLLDLALKKQRLQFESAALRQKFQGDLDRLSPLFGACDSVVAGGRWLHAHPQWIAGAGVLLLVTRPSWLWRWARRGFFLWQTWRKVRGWSASF